MNVPTSVEPLHAVVETGTVLQVVVMSPEVATLFRSWGVFGDADLVDITDLLPQPGIGWSYEDEHFTPPGPATPPQPDPTPEPVAS